MHTLLSYFAILLPLIVIDALWLGIIAKGFYTKHLGYLFGESVNFAPVLVFYIIYSVAILIFAVQPSLSSGLWFEALWRGALLGLAAYAAYDLTNHATIANWPTIVTLADLAWGLFVTGVVSVFAFFIVSNFRGV